MSKLWPLKLASFSSFCHTIRRKIFKLPKLVLKNPFDLNDIKFCRVVKMPFSIAFQKLGLVAPILYNTIFDDVM